MNPKPKKKPRKKSPIVCGDEMRNVDDGLLLDLLLKEMVERAFNKTATISSPSNRAAYFVGYRDGLLDGIHLVYKTASVSENE